MCIRDRYLENAPIIRSLRAMGIDTEKFWMAMLFVYDVVRERTENVQVPTSVFEEFRAFARYLQENPDAKVRAWQGREHGVTPVSYTHLDVYKRQWCRSHERTR